MKSISLEEDIKVTEYNQRAEDPMVMVMGVGGGGGNIVTQMYQEADFGGVSFVLCNTDKQDLYNKHLADIKIQLGRTGLGAGAHRDSARKSAEYPQTQAEIRECLSSDALRMLFIVATLGGGTGTGAAPVIARIAKEIPKTSEDNTESDNLLVIGVVTIPSKSEGEGCAKLALSGLEELMKYTDAVIIIHNEGALKAVGADAPCSDADDAQNQIPIQALKAISWIVNETMQENVDFNDIKNVLKGGESALISIGYGSGPNRMKDAIYEATHSHFLKNKDIFKAKRLLYCMLDNSDEYGKEVKLKVGERDDIIHKHFINYFQNIESDPESNKKSIIRGRNHTFPEFEKKNIKEKDTIGLIILATGFLFQKEEIYDPSDWDDDFFNDGESDDKINLEKELYEKGYSSSDNINVQPKVYGLPTELLDNEACIQLLERESPAFRDEQTMKKYDEIARKQRRPNPLDSNLNN